MNKTTVKFKKLDERAQMPHYGTEFAAGADLYACLDAPLTIAKGATEFVHTGIAMEIPTGLVGLVYARSGLACKKGLAPANKVGVVDSDYRGEVMVALFVLGLAVGCYGLAVRLLPLERMGASEGEVWLESAYTKAVPDADASSCGEGSRAKEVRDGSAA